MTTDAQAPTDAPLSLDGAADLLDAADAAANNSQDGAAGEAGDVQGEDFEADSTAENIDDEIDDEDDEQGEPAQPAIDPPASWDGEAKAHFAQLPSDLQTYVVEREAQRDAAVSQAQDRAANAEKDMAIIDAFGAVLDQIVPKAMATFGDRWADVNFKELAESDPEEYWRLKALHDEEQAEVGRLQLAQLLAPIRLRRDDVVFRERFQVLQALFEFCCRVEHKEDAVLVHLELHARRTELVQDLEAARVQADERVHRASVRVRARATPESPKPAAELDARPQLDRERARGPERPAQRLTDDPGEDVTTLCKTLLEAARDFAAAPLTDDVAILAIRKT